MTAFLRTTAGSARPGLWTLAALARPRLLRTWGWRLGLVGALGLLGAGVLLSSWLEPPSGDDGALALVPSLRQLLGGGGMLVAAGPLGLSVARGGAWPAAGLEALARMRGARELDLERGAALGACSVLLALLWLPWLGLFGLGLVEGSNAPRELGVFLLEGLLRSLLGAALMGLIASVARRLPRGALAVLLAAPLLALLLGGRP